MIFIALLGLTAYLPDDTVAVGATGTQSNKMRLTDELAREAGSLWESVVQHRFTDEVGSAGTRTRPAVELSNNS